MHSGLSEPHIKLVGAPNSGKTTLYNWLTGSKYRTVNYPGSTVDMSLGEVLPALGANLKVIDTPGLYSLFPKSPEEHVTTKLLYSQETDQVPQVIVAVVDATQISRHLFVVRQLKEAGFSVVVALTMLDLLKRSGLKIRVDELSKILNCPVIEVDGRLGGGVKDLVSICGQQINAPFPKIVRLDDWSGERIEKVFLELGDVAKKVEGQIDIREATSKTRKPSDAKKITDQVDRWLLHPFWGSAFFILIMSLLFSSIFWVAQPLMDIVDGVFTAAASSVSSVGKGSLFFDFLSSGIIASFGAVLVFVPQILILFLGLIFIEDTGYLARAASLIDKPLSKLGLNGKSFVPLLSAYACAVPAMMAARTISSRKERWLTLLVIPLMSCSARLPVYALLLSFLFRSQPAWIAGIVLALIYVGSLFLGAIAALIADKTLKFSDKSIFMLELPYYRRPHMRTVLKSAFTRTRSYVSKAGPVIFVLSLIIWVLTTFPHYELQDKTQRLQSSYAAQMGQFIEPIMKPMGGDWRVGVGLIAAFAAREVFVSSMAIVFSVTTEDEDSLQQSLLQKMSEAKTAAGAPLFTVASVVGLIIFFMIALQCIATVSVARRESGNWTFAILQLLVFNLVAYALSVSVVQMLYKFGFT